ncbi:MAG: hypothetical protein FVQ82_08895 [Planctomycetes bacterium]|nr:hypothetical protein [Planctomycetota bacterium]
MKTLQIIALLTILTSVAFSANKGQKGHIIPFDEAEMQSNDSASHKEIKPIGTTKETEFKALSTFCMDSKGNLLACDSKAKLIKVIGSDGKLLDTWKLDFAPYSIVSCQDGSTYIAGIGVVCKVDAKGKVVKTADVKGMPFEKSKASGIAFTKKDVFVCFGTGWSLRSLSTIVRFSRDLKSPKMIAEKLRGCCQRLDIVARKGFLFVAENARHRVLKMDRDGKILAKWGKRDRMGTKGFGSCCNPMNLCFGKDGVLFTAESGLGRIKRYTPDGKYLGLVGHIGVERFTRASRKAASCSNIPLAISKDQSRIYVLDFTANLIRVMAKIEKDKQKP